MTPKASLLVVDDELIVRDSLDKWFREEGYASWLRKAPRKLLPKWPRNALTSP